MAYIQDTYYLGDYIATEIKFIGRNGAKGERRAKKKLLPSRWQGRISGRGKRKRNT